MSQHRRHFLTRTFADLPIRNKLAGIILVTTILALATGFALVSYRSVRLFEENLLKSFGILARAAGDYSAFFLFFPDPEEATDTLAKLEEFDNVLEAQLFDTRGELFASFSRGGELSRPPRLGDPRGEIRDGYVHVFVPVTWNGKRYGTIYVRGSTADLEALKRQHLGYMATVMLALVVAAIILAYLLQGLISKPILHLAERTQEITRRGDYSIRVEKPGNDEIGMLCDGFNAMLTQIELRQSELERSNRDLDQFAYVASHDLKAPLRAISTISGWLEEDLSDQLPDDARHQLGLLRNRVGRMNALIDGILQYSRVGRGHTEGELIDVEELLREVIELVHPPPGFRVEIGSGMPSFVARRFRLSQVFSNLITNAIKYHHRDRGRIEITVRRVLDERRDGEEHEERAREKPDHGFYEFAVSDDGPGIAPQHHEKIFAMFQTLQPRDEVESTGLGLSLVKKLVEEEGGEIWVESDVGQGATFRFTWSGSVPGPDLSIGLEDPKPRKRT